MNIIKKTAGKALNILTKAISTLFDIVISLVSFSVTLTNTIAKGFVTMIGMGGCLLFFIWAGPLGVYFILNPITILIFLFFILFPILGTKFISLLKYIQYMITEYLLDIANYLIYGTNREFNSFFEYGNKYKREQEAKRRREQQKRQEEMWREWEERFKTWQEFQNSQENYGNSSSYNNYNNHTFNNPTLEFKKKYEESCNILGIPYDADKYQIKLAYRKKAKEYHPDLNKSPNATEMFQKINNAYEFLSDNNIERYKNIK